MWASLRVGPYVAAEWNQGYDLFLYTNVSTCSFSLCYIDKLLTTLICYTEDFHIGWEKFQILCFVHIMIPSWLVRSLTSSNFSMPLSWLGCINFVSINTNCISTKHIITDIFICNLLIVIYVVPHEKILRDDHKHYEKRELVFTSGRSHYIVTGLLYVCFILLTSFKFSYYFWRIDLLLFVFF